MSNHPPEPRKFEFRLHIAASRDAVFEALTTDKVLSRWFAPKNTMQAQVGGQVRWQWKDHFDWAQRVEILEPGTRLQTRYDSSVDDGAGGKRPLWIDFFLESERGGGTNLRVVHHGFDADARFDGEFDGISSGWPVELQSLKLYLERHAGEDRQLAWAHTKLESSADVAWQRLVGADGLACGTDGTRPKAGDAFELTIPAPGPNAEPVTVTGEVLCTGDRELVGVAESHGDAFLRVRADGCGGGTHVWLWLACYDQPDALVAQVQASWDALLARLFAESGIEAKGGVEA